MLPRSTYFILCGALVLVAFSSIGFGSGPQSLAGAWNVTIDFEGLPPCTAPSPLNADGGMIANACAASESPGYGQWVRTGNRRFAVTFVGLEYAPDGSTNGT